MTAKTMRQGRTNRGGSAAGIQRKNEGINLSEENKNAASAAFFCLWNLHHAMLCKGITAPKRRQSMNAASATRKAVAPKKRLERASAPDFGFAAAVSTTPTKLTATATALMYIPEFMSGADPPETPPGIRKRRRGTNAVTNAAAFSAKPAKSIGLFSRFSAIPFSFAAYFILIFYIKRFAMSTRASQRKDDEICIRIPEVFKEYAFRGRGGKGEQKLAVRDCRRECSSRKDALHQ